ncbi:hypothetical protein, partial [Marinospirillum insulare]|uniref:hypothetical protein n=1 Tax=Marinospirillum insulare TaxID=217169 RepID=UPI0024E0A613
MKKLMLLFVLLLAFTTGCSRTFVVTNSEKLETNHLLVSSYTDQGIDVKETKNWTLGNTSGMNSYVYVEGDKAIKNVPKAPSLVPDLIVNFPFNSTSMHPESTANLASFIGELSIDKKLKLIGSWIQLASATACNSSNNTSFGVFIPSVFLGRLFKR